MNPHFAQLGRRLGTKKLQKGIDHFVNVSPGGHTKLSPLISHDLSQSHCLSLIFNFLSLLRTFLLFLPLQFLSLLCALLSVVS